MTDRKFTFNAAKAYVAQYDSYKAQLARVQRVDTQEESWGERIAARRWRFDPLRSLDSNPLAVASYVHREDSVIDVGGGAGRVSLPLALRCREVINIDPSSGMKAEYEESAREAGLSNTQFIQSDWADVAGVSANLAITANLTYFVRDIVPFIRKMEEMAERRVIINLWSVPPCDQNAAIFRLVYREEKKTAPGHRYLLPVIWELGILPDVQVLPGAFREGELPQTIDAAVQEAMRGQWLHPKDRDFATNLILEHFEEHYELTSQGYRSLWQEESRELLISWEPSKAGV